MPAQCSRPCRTPYLLKYMRGCLFSLMRIGVPPPSKSPRESERRTISPYLLCGFITPTGNGHRKNFLGGEEKSVAEKANLSRFLSAPLSCRNGGNLCPFPFAAAAVYHHRDRSSHRRRFCPLLLFEMSRPDAPLFLSLSFSRSSPHAQRGGRGRRLRQTNTERGEEGSKVPPAREI